MISEAEQIIPSNFDNLALECQDCGDRVRMLSLDELRRVAERPYNYVVYCQVCRRSRAEETP